MYLDDIVIYGTNLEERNKKLTTVLQRLRRNNLKLQPEKCKLFRKEVTYVLKYLGHIILEDGILPNHGKLDAMCKFLVSKKAKDIQSFIGLVGYYRKFIENYS